MSILLVSQHFRGSVGPPERMKVANRVAWLLWGEIGAKWLWDADIFILILAYVGSLVTMLECPNLGAM